MESDVYKEEAFRLLVSQEQIESAARKFIFNLRGKFVPAVKIEIMNINSYRSHDRFAATLAGEVYVVEDQDWSKRPIQTHQMQVTRQRLQRRWLVRKMREYGELIGANPNQVSSSNGHVRFSYHVVVKQESFLTD